MNSKLWLIPFILLTLIACKRKSGAYNYDQLGATHNLPKKSEAELKAFIAESKQKIKDGDLIMRTGIGLESEAIRNLSQKDKTFSHCGLAFHEDGQVYVYNAIGGKENPSEKLLREPFETFVDPAAEDGFGIYRYSLSDSEISALYGILLDYYKKGVLFDHAFDLKTDDRMYCAEVIYKSLKQATNNRVALPTTTIKNYTARTPNLKERVFKDFEYIGVDDLFINPFCQLITLISYR